MALQRITYEDKSALLAQNEIADINKISDTDMNEIKTVVNAIASATDTNVNDISSLKSRVSALETSTSVASIIDIVYPIGSIYITYDSTNPGTRWSGTTWIREAEGRCIIGLGTGYPTAGATGGGTTINLSHTHTSAAHTHSINSHTHSTSDHALTIDQMPSHTHIQNSHNHPIPYNANNSAYSSGWPYAFSSGLTSETNGKGWNGNAGTFKITATNQNTGGGQGHNHGNTGETSLTTNSTAPGNTGSALSSTQSIMQPYIVMYIWRRTK